MKLVGFHYRQRTYTVRRYATGLKASAKCSGNNPFPIGITSIQPETRLRVTLTEGPPNTVCTLKGGSLVESLTLVKFNPLYSANKFSQLDSVVCSADCTISIYASEEVGFDLGEVKGAVYTDKRAIGVDEFNRITLVSTSVLVCLPGVEIQTDDILIDQESNDHFSVVKAQPAFDRRGRLHHWELDVVQVRER